MRTQHEYHDSGSISNPGALTAVGDPFTVYGECTQFNVTVANVGAALTDFAIQYRNKASGDWVTIVSASEWDDTDKILKLWNNPATMNNLGDDVTGGIQFVFGPVYQLRFLANSAGDTTLTIDGFASF